MRRQPQFYKNVFPRLLRIPCRVVLLVSSLSIKLDCLKNYSIKFMVWQHNLDIVDIMVLHPPQYWGIALCFPENGCPHDRR